MALIRPTTIIARVAFGTTIAIASLLLLAGAAAAKPKTLYYEGKTAEGNTLALQLKGKRVSGIRGMINATCSSTYGLPETILSEFAPPGSYKVGTTRKVTSTEFVAYRGNVTKNYTIGIERLHPHLWRADLSVNYSYEQFSIGDFGEPEQTFYICRGDDAFLFKV
jgi:hypothetical protein